MTSSSTSEERPRDRLDDQDGSDGAGPFPSSSALQAMLDELQVLRADLKAAEERHRDRIAALAESRRASARNLVHYMTLRGRDLRGLQNSLSNAGLSSLGRSEPYVLANVEAVIAMLQRAVGETSTLQTTPDIVSPPKSWSILEAEADQLLGTASDCRDVRIMVTMPTEAATDSTVLRDFVEAGMDCMRINAAHDGPDDWRAMIANLRAAEAEFGRSCRILMDLPGPRVRTGPIEEGPAVIKIEPMYDDLGQVLSPGRVWLAVEGTSKEPPEEAETTLPLPADFLRHLKRGDEVTVRDPTGVDRTLAITEITARGGWAEAGETVYIATGARLLHEGDAERAITVGDLPSLDQKLLLNIGDTLILTRGDEPGAPARRDPHTGEREPARIGCVPTAALENVRAGERIWFDDGRIGGVIREAADEVIVEITGTRPGGDKLKPEKGINLPDSDLRLPALGADDRALIPFAVDHADMVGYSFVGTADDISELRTALKDAGGEHLGIVLKIERNIAFQELPRLLLEGMHHSNLGVMIARGDLAVECGFARMAEIQEEILWLCSAAHVPVIWATEVMDRLAKRGRPSRAEVTDAAMGGRAECIMLNKGPHIPDAVRALNSILLRMQEHQQKKRPMLRRLEVATRFLEAAD